MLVVSAVLAYMLNCMGIRFYHPPHVRAVAGGAERAGCPGAPLLSTILFATGVTLILVETEIYPKALRKLHILPQAAIEFIICWHVIEWALSDFWFPVESFFIKEAVPRLKKVLEPRLQDEPFSEIVSYFLSLSFIACVLHAVRVADFRLLRCGPKLFYKDMGWRFCNMISKTKAKLKRKASKAASKVH